MLSKIAITCWLMCSLYALVVSQSLWQRNSRNHGWNYNRRHMYSGRHHHNVAARGRTRRMGVSLHGPHVCSERGSTFCCPGWSIDRTGMCTKPICEEGMCKNSGICQSPNMCLCTNGRTMRECPKEPSEEMRCNIRCMHGGECLNNQCRCTYGFTGPHCEQAICGPGCLNGGRCIAPGKCACVYGFTGMRCERDYRKGPCFMTRSNNTCTNQVPKMMCTKLLCCATVGEGWGNPCEECPARVGNCTKGRLPPHCTDINECDIMPELCGGGQCVNTDGSFRCECPPGLQYDRSTQQCLDINECLSLSVCAGGECVNTDGGFTCHCPPDTKMSQDRTYCISDVPGRCYTAIESGMCATPLPQMVTRTTCCCLQSGQETLGKCFAAIGQFPERCASIGSPEYERECAGVDFGGSGGDICSIMGDTACVNGRCVVQQEVNDYFCECNFGYEVSEDNKQCVDTDECGLNRNICGSYGTCLNTEGSFRCHCANGFENPPDIPTSCVDINECVASNGRDLCVNGVCVNTKGSFICNCDDGYYASATQQSCVDVNECEETAGLCENGRCINLDGDYRCICDPGFEGAPSRKECLDTNECERNNMCANGRCKNMNGSYKCVCHAGFQLVPSGERCVDINECENNPCINGRCKNTRGSFICICHEFKVLDETGLRCILDQQLAQCFRDVRNGQCRPSNALNIAATRADCCCSVPGGTSAWGDSCEPCPETTDADYSVLCYDHRPENICDLLPNACENGHCIKMGKNEYRCECDVGFEVSADQRACIDFDECTQSLCSNGECRNTPGSYSCTCYEGFLLNGDVCEDINECLSNPCVDGNCINIPGRYRCVCPEGSKLDLSGHICYDIRQGRCWSRIDDGQCSDSVGTELMTAEECCNTVGMAWGSTQCIPCSEIELRCERGYSFDIATDRCVNIDECEFNVCEEDMVCTDTEGSFRCDCPPGLTLLPDGISCIDYRVGTCFMELDSFGGCDFSGSSGAHEMKKASCCCTIGKAWGDDCELCPDRESQEHKKLCENFGLRNNGTKNECIIFPNLCSFGVCKNTGNSFVCICNRGFTIDESGRNCTDIDECVISPGICENGQCVNIDGDFQCDCLPGFKASLETKVCIDVDECVEEAHCKGGNCINTQGSFVCECPDGRSLSEDESDCIDIDECALQSELCAPNGRCENMLGYYMCLCDKGYVATPDAQNCVDVNECENNNGNCQMDCTNTIGSYECTCDDGYVLSFDGHTCADRDECMEQMNRCDGGRCENRDGSFRCICFDGFMSTNDLQFCEDIDECAMNPHVCMNGRCHNTRGSYTCNCEPGYCVPQGQMICVDENECELSKHHCHVNADCNNTEGGYECSCIQGFNGDGFMCHDDNECELGTHMCHDHAMCRNKLGGYECDCEEGYHGDGFSCSDNDDCLENENLCGPHGVCLNVDGSFECDCQMGFVTTDDRKACKDIDECAFENICVNGRCHNVPGTFNCKCLDGYEKDERGANCTDIDECLDIANCVNGECHNADGSYECECPEGFQQNPTGIGCVDNRIGDCYLHSDGDPNAPICTDPIGIGITKATCCCTHVEAWGNPCELCPDFNTTEYDTLCPGGIGFMPNPYTVLLEDINECISLPGLCQGGRCINVFGSYSCACNIGYQLNQETKACEDVDECNVPGMENICGAGECRNSVGGYNCVCPEGYKAIQGGRKCEDIRVESCFRHYNETSQECSSDLFSQTKKLCCCYENIGQGWNTPCEKCPEPESDEFVDLCDSRTFIKADNICEANKHLCTDGICIDNGDGSFICECPTGFFFNENLLICEDYDDCVAVDQPCYENAECVNKPGTYVCVCMNGYAYNEEIEICEDINECETGTVCANGDCSNGEGSYECDCNNGFRAVNNDTACEDIDECARDPCGNGVCQNVFGSFTCTCDNGYRISDNGDCVDVNECEETDQCGKGTCENLPGGFGCDCNDGYIATPDGRNCIDLNECQLDADICGVGMCQNMDGSFKCYCPDGYTDGDGKTCEDIDECATREYCIMGTCNNINGSFECECPEGHSLTTNKRNCVDTRPAQCFSDIAANAVCSGAGAILLTRSTCCCQCKNAAWGFGESNCTACPAEDTKEFTDLCPHGCGYSPDGIDIDECLDNPCDNGRCLNIAGGFKCICMAGYKLDDSNVTCVDINECEKASVCGYGTCENTKGSFECECAPGFYNGPNIVCLDIDECRDDELNHCGFRCENTLGSFHCACPQGYQLRADGRMCEDINECSTDALNDCTAKGMSCKNVIGGFICLCPTGYRRIGTSDACVDINECEMVRVCTYGVCVNLEGSYRCDCNEGYEFDEENKLCVDTRQGRCFAAVHQRMCEVNSSTGLYFTKAECCCTRGKGWGEECEECPHPGTESFLDLCPHGSGYLPDGSDVDDCKILPGLCAHGTCINTLGSYKCACNHGYEPSPNRKACLDINECVQTPSPCSFDCRNTDGSFVCVCPKGYQLDHGGSSCVDLDECNTKRHNCQYVCKNTVGSFQCQCPHGFVQEESQCVDKNECADMPGICGARGICRNDIGSYRCECPRGFRIGMGEACVDVDECAGGQGECAGGCQNVPGSFRCLCGNGYSPTLYGRGCQDVNECIHSPCGIGQTCTNNNGGFECGCGRGLAKMGSSCGDVDECQMGGGSCQYGCQNTYGGFSCTCPAGFYRMGAGHCIQSAGGFQQRMPFIPYQPRPYQPPMQDQFRRPPPLYPQDTVCYSCMPGGDVPRRQRRSADKSKGRFIEVNDHHGRAALNTSFPVEIFIHNQDLTHHSELLKLQTSMKQLRKHSHYEIVSGNDDHRFRISHDDHVNILHFTKKAIDADNSVATGPEEVTLRLRAASTLDEQDVSRAAFESETIQEALQEVIELDIKINLYN